MKKVNKKKDIYQAAALLFGEKGYENTSLDEIAKKADVAKGTIFYYFNSKDELFSDLVEEGINILSEEISKITLQNIDIKEKLEKITEYHFSFFKEHAGVCLMILGQLGSFQKRWHKDANLIRTKYMSILELLIQEGKKEKIINQYLDTEAVVVSLFSLLAVSGVDWAIFHPKMSKEKIIDTTKLIMFNGIFS